MCLPFEEHTLYVKCELNVVWNETMLINTVTPVYLGIHLDITLPYKVHTLNTKLKVNARNNIIRKLANSKWGCKVSTLRTSCLALYSYRVRLSCVCKDYTCKQVKACPTRLLPNHSRRSQTIKRDQHIPDDRSCSFSHWENTCKPRGTPRQKPATNFTTMYHLLAD